MFRLLPVVIVAALTALGQTQCPRGFGPCSPGEREIFELNQQCAQCEFLPDFFDPEGTCLEVALELREGYDDFCANLDQVGGECGSYSDYLDTIAAAMQLCEGCD